MDIDKTKPLREYTAIHVIYQQRLEKTKRYIPMLWGEASVEDIDRIVQLVNELLRKYYYWIEDI